MPLSCSNEVWVLLLLDRGLDVKNRTFAYSITLVNKDLSLVIKLSLSCVCVCVLLYVWSVCVSASISMLCIIFIPNFIHYHLLYQVSPKVGGVFYELKISWSKMSVTHSWSSSLPSSSTFRSSSFADSYLFFPFSSQPLHGVFITSGGCVSKTYPTGDRYHAQKTLYYFLMPRTWDRKKKHESREI